VPPLGAGVPGEPEIAVASLEPGDLLLFYTDGLTDARGPDGEPFTLQAVARFIEREAAAGHTGPETLRRIRQAIIGRERAQLRDDATALLVEWRAGDELRLMPQTVL
jgi:serine phosphatase RsbU (regulator of sigma subunit)